MGTGGVPQQPQQTVPVKSVLQNMLARKTSVSGGTSNPLMQLQLQQQQQQQQQTFNRPPNNLQQQQQQNAMMNQQQQRSFSQQIAPNVFIVPS